MTLSPRMRRFLGLKDDPQPTEPKPEVLSPRVRKFLDIYSPSLLATGAQQVKIDSTTYVVDTFVPPIVNHEGTNYRIALSPLTDREALRRQIDAIMCSAGGNYAFHLSPADIPKYRGRMAYSAKIHGVILRTHILDDWLHITVIR